MKRYTLLLIGVVSLLLTSCDYFGDYTFDIENKSDDTVTVAYYEQLQSTEDILPTYEHGEDYEWIHLADTPTVVTLEPDSRFRRVYEVGRVSKKWPTEEDTPERYHIVPMWDRIAYITLGADTLKAEDYEKAEWTNPNGSRCWYKLEVW